jgi:hypothetical protein
MNENQKKEYNIDINLDDFTKSDFKISINPKIMDIILGSLEIKGKELYYLLNKSKSQESKDIASSKRSYLMLWKKGKRIPIDCFESLCRLSGKNLRDYQTNIYEISSQSSRNNWRASLPIKLTDEFFIISEAIRTEGNIIKGKSKKNLTQGLAISNKDVFLLKIIENNLKKLNIDLGISRILTVVIYLDNDDIDEIIDKNENKKLHFRFNKGRLFFTQQVKDYNVDKEYVITIKNQNKSLKVKISNKNIVFTESDLKTTAYVTLQVYNSVFSKFLSYFFDIPYGIGNNKTYNIDFPFEIEKLSDKIVSNILDIVISCEGTVLFNKPKGDRRVSIKIASEKYLQKLQIMLKRFDIESTIRKSSKTEKLYILDIRRKSNLVKLSQNVDILMMYKKDKLNEIVNSYKYDV